jgi:hypothetical protein
MSVSLAESWRAEVKMEVAMPAMANRRSLRRCRVFIREFDVELS